MSKLDSVFDDCTEKELDFDVIFDEDDSLIDTVNGVNESGDPLTGVDFEDLHQTQDDATKKDVEDELGPGHDEKMGAPNPEGSKEAEVTDNSVKGQVGKPSDADDFYEGSDDEYQKGLKGAKPDDTDVTATIDKAIGEGVDIDDVLDPSTVADGADIDDILDDDDDIPMGEATDIDDVLDGDDDDIDEVMNTKAQVPNLDYDMSDEDLIDMAINGN